MPNIDYSDNLASHYNELPGVRIRDVEQAKADAHNCEFFCPAAYSSLNKYGWNEGSLP